MLKIKATYCHCKLTENVTIHALNNCNLPLILTGHVPVTIVLLDNLDPSTVLSLITPLVMTVYITSHSSPLSITTAIPLDIVALPETYKLS